MQRLAALLLLALLAVSLASCGGGGSKSAPTSLTLSPTSMTLNSGEWMTITPAFVNSGGTTVYPKSPEVTYTSDRPDLVDVRFDQPDQNPNGTVCAGKWKDAYTCTPATTYGKATVTVKSGTASATMTVYVHPNVTRISISGSVDLANCVSLAASDKTAILSAHAFDQSGTDVTPNVGPFTWTTSGVASVDTSGKCTSDNTCVLTAIAPGQTKVYAALGGTSSSFGTFTTCPVKSISLHMPSSADTSASLNAAATQALAFDMVDSKDNPLTTITPTYSSSQSVVASLTGSSTVTAPTLTASSPGTTSLVASCNPASGCNTGMTAVFSNVFTAKVNSGSTPTATTVYVGSTAGTSLIPVDTSNNTAGTAITLPYTPNTIAMSNNGSAVYLGSSSGLMVVNTSAGTVTTVTAAPGKVIGVSPDQTVVFVYNPPASAPGTGTLYVFTISNSSVTSTPIPNAGTSARAVWAPDGSVAYVLTGSKLVVRSGGAVLPPVDAGQANDIDFLAQGSFAYLAGSFTGLPGGGSDVSVRATCTNTVVDSKTVGGTPAFVRSLPNATAMLALYPNDLSAAAARYLSPITVATTGAGCPPSVTNTPATTPLLLGTFIPGQVIAAPNSSKVFVTATDSPTVFSYDVASGQATPITLTGTGILAAGITVDSGRLYVAAAGNNSLHVIDTSTNTDTAQIAIGFQPDLVAVKPK